MKFQALGSNYSGSDAIKQLFAFGTSEHSRELTRKLENRYGGHAYLFAKGRLALAEAVRTVRESDHTTIAINALTCSVVVEAVTSQDATPLYVDVASGTAHYDADGLDAALSANEHAAAVVVQNTFGRMCDIAAIERVAKKHGVFIIEDLAHSMGQTYPDGREAGTVGDLVMLSFGRDKLLDVVNGGALIVRNPRLHVSVNKPTQSPRLIDQVRDRIYPALTWLVRATYDMKLGRYLLAGMYRFGLATKSSDGSTNRHLRLPHWQAKRVLAHYSDYPAMLKQRQARMKQYEQLLDNSMLSRGGVIRAALTVDDRADVLSKLREHGYELADTWYDTPIGPARKFAELDYPSASCPNAVDIAKHVINLPTHRYISRSDATTMTEIVRQV